MKKGFDGVFYLTNPKLAAVETHTVKYHKKKVFCEIFGVGLKKMNAQKCFENEKEVGRKCNLLT